MVDEPSLDAGQEGGIAGRRAIADDVLARKAIAYSGYRENQSPGTHRYPTADQVHEDLQLLIRGGWTFLRLFDCSQHAETVLKVIQENALDVKVLLGVWISGKKAIYDVENREQIEKCVSLSSTYRDVVVAVSVGNETLDDWSSVRVPPAELTDYIKEVRERVTQPVTTDDMYLPFSLGVVGTTSYADVLQVLEAVDFLDVHVYAFIDARWSWEWRQLGTPEGPERARAMMKAGLIYTEGAIRSVLAALYKHKLDLPILIGEAGWKTKNTRAFDDPDATYRAHPVNQKMYYDSLMSWVYGSTKDGLSPKGAFYFEAFDEPWKSEDDAWGLFDVDRKAKYAIWDLFPDRKPANAPAYTEADAVYYKPAPPPADAGVNEGGAPDASTTDGPLDDAAPDATPTAD
ncbi:MAG TPA: hypothetical protein VF881_09210 [Polyangiaceae bacterium]